MTIVSAETNPLNRVACSFPECSAPAEFLVPDAASDLLLNAIFLIFFFCLLNPSKNSLTKLWNTSELLPACALPFQRRTKHSSHPPRQQLRAQGDP